MIKYKACGPFLKTCLDYKRQCPLLVSWRVKVSQSCLTLWHPGLYRILQARILEWVAFPFSRGSSQPRNWTGVSCIAGGFFTSRPVREALGICVLTPSLLCSSPAGLIGAFPSQSVKYREGSGTLGCNQNGNTSLELTMLKTLSTGWKTHVSGEWDIC